jgi:hypothetical protein
LGTIANGRSANKRIGRAVCRSAAEGVCICDFADGERPADSRSLPCRQRSHRDAPRRFAREERGYSCGSGDPEGSRSQAAGHHRTWLGSARPEGDSPSGCGTAVMKKEPNKALCREANRRSLDHGFHGLHGWQMSHPCHPYDCRSRHLPLAISDVMGLPGYPFVSALNAHPRQISSATCRADALRCRDGCHAILR